VRRGTTRRQPESLQKKSTILFFFFSCSLSLHSAVHSLVSALPSLTRLPLFFHSLAQKKESKRAGGFEDTLRQKNLVRVKANRARAIENESINPIDFSNSWETVGRELLSIRVNHRSHIENPSEVLLSLHAQKIHAAEREFTPVFNEKKKQKRKFLKNGDVFALRERVWLRLVRGEGHGLDRGHAASRRGNRQVRLSVLFFFIASSLNRF